MDLADGTQVAGRGEHLAASQLLPGKLGNIQRQALPATSFASIAQKALNAAHAADHAAGNQLDLGPDGDRAVHGNAGNDRAEARAGEDLRNGHAENAAPARGDMSFGAACQMLIERLIALEGFRGKWANRRPFQRGAQKEIVDFALALPDHGASTRSIFVSATTPLRTPIKDMISRCSMVCGMMPSSAAITRIARSIPETPATIVRTNLS